MIVQCYFILKVSNKILLIHLITTSDATLGSALTLLLKTNAPVDHRSLFINLVIKVVSCIHLLPKGTNQQTCMFDFNWLEVCNYVCPGPTLSWVELSGYWYKAHVGSRASSVIIILHETSLTTRKYCADRACQLLRWKYQYYSMHYHKTMAPSLSRGNTQDLWTSLRMKIGIKRIKCHFLYNLVIYKAILSDGLDYFSVVCNILHKNYQ